MIHKIKIQHITIVVVVLRLVLGNVLVALLEHPAPLATVHPGVVGTLDLADPDHRQVFGSVRLVECILHDVGLMGFQGEGI